MSPPPASALGAVLGALVAYIGNRQYTFKSQRLHSVALPRFLLTAVISAGLNALLVWAGLVLGWHYYAAQAVATCIIFMLAFQINRAWTFKQ